MKFIVTFPEGKKDDVINDLKLIEKQMESYNKSLAGKAAIKAIQFITKTPKGIKTKFSKSEFTLGKENQIIWDFNIAVEALLDKDEIAKRFDKALKKYYGDRASVKIWKPQT